MQFILFANLFLAFFQCKAENIDSLLIVKFDNFHRNSIIRYEKTNSIKFSGFDIEKEKSRKNYFIIGRDKRDSIVEVQYIKENKISAVLEIMEDSLIKISMYRSYDNCNYFLYHKSLIYRSKNNNLYLIKRGSGIESPIWRIEFISLLSSKLTEVFNYDVESRMLKVYRTDRLEGYITCKEKIFLNYTSFLDVVYNKDVFLKKGLDFNCIPGFNGVGIPDFFD